MFQPPQARAKIIAASAERGILSEPLATNLQLVEITGHLHSAPGAQGVFADTQQIAFRAARKTKCSHSQREN